MRDPDPRFIYSTSPSGPPSGLCCDVMCLPLALGRVHASKHDRITIHPYHEIPIHVQINHSEILSLRFALEKESPAESAFRTTVTLEAIALPIVCRQITLRRVTNYKSGF